MKEIIIIGGGIAGLGAAYKIKRAQKAGEDVSFTLIEKEERVGGQLWTDRFIDDKGHEIIADGGSDSFMTEKPSIHRVAKMLGMFDEEQSTNDDVKKTFIVKKGKLVEMPDGIMMFAPTKILPMATTSLYSWPAKFRMAVDFFMPKKKQPATGLEDESVESLVVRRLGRECLDNLAEAIVGGVNGSDPKTMSVLATYPSLLEMEQKYGSLIKGFLAQRKKVEAIKKKYPPKPGARRKTFFSSFERGLGSLTDAMADAAGREHMLLGCGVKAVEIDRDFAEAGGTAEINDAAGKKRYRVTLEDGRVIEGDGLIVATPAWQTAEFFSEALPEAADVLNTIPNSSCGTVVIAFDKEDAPFDKAWHGILTPAVEHRKVTGISLVSSKWLGRCPDDKVLIRGFVGGPRDPEMLDLSDDEIIDLARATYEELLGLRKGAPIRYAKVFRFPRSMPQYTVGHLDRMKELWSLVDPEMGLCLAGAPYKGVGVPNCLQSGEDAATKVLGDFGIELAEDKQEEKRLY